MPTLTDLSGFTVVRLGLSVSASVRPVASVALSGGSDLAAGARPEPAVYIGRLQVSAVAASEVAFTSRGPNIPDVTACDPLFDEFIFL